MQQMQKAHEQNIQKMALTSEERMAGWLQQKSEMEEHYSRMLDEIQDRHKVFYVTNGSSSSTTKPVSRKAKSPMMDSISDFTDMYIYTVNKEIICTPQSFICYLPVFDSSCFLFPLIDFIRNYMK